MREVRRENDWAAGEPGELVGLLLPAGGGRWVPATVFGAALGPAADERDAESLVRERGLSSLADRWRVRVAGGSPGGRPGCWRSNATGSGCVGRPDADADRPR